MLRTRTVIHHRLEPEKANAKDATDAKVRYGIRGAPLRPPRPLRSSFARNERFIPGGSAQPVDDWYGTGFQP